MSHAANEYVKHLRIAPNGAKITPAEKSVLGQLADDHNQDKGCAWPSVGNLAARACMTDRHCRRLLRELEAKGVIELNPRLRENGGRSSSEYRFCQIDPPFDVKAVALTQKRMQLQLTLAATRPKQQSLLPPDTDVRGARTPKSGGGGQREHGGEDTDVRGARTPSSPQEPLFNTSTDKGLNTSPDPKSDPPTPFGKGANLNQLDAHGRNPRWDEFKLMLKSELLSIPGNLAAAKGFSEVIPGQNDWTSCFEEWFLDEVRVMPNGLLFVTWANDEESTAVGLEKYRERLTRLARRYFESPHKSITFKLEREVAVPQSSAPAPAKADQWEQLKQQLLREIESIRSGQTRQEHITNFHSAIAQTRLLSVEMMDAQPLWKVASPNAKKTRAVLGLLRMFVNSAMHHVAGGAVQLLIVEGGHRTI